MKQKINIGEEKLLESANNFIADIANNIELYKRIYGEENAGLIALNGIIGGVVNVVNIYENPRKALIEIIKQVRRLLRNLGNGSKEFIK